MTFKEVADLLATTGYPVTYLMWKEDQVPDLPYICYHYTDMTPETADDTHHAQIYSLNVELYTSNKQFSVESTVESVLLDAGMVFTKEETFLSDENMYEVLYMMEVVING
ncbi:MAG TPA: hypothetical protein DCG51_11270 [Erysipelotrichaceae bacterium]|nr:hypothetical protein [Erysipelotrichaceae bacterium]